MSKPDPVKEQILNQADIADIVSQYVYLEQKGGRLWGLSPFNKEKTPSFTVSTDRQFYKCFSSGKGGNVIDFIIEMENLTFFEAKQFLANKLGITMPKQNRHRDHQEIDRFQVMDSAANLFRNWLKHNDHALEYMKSRGLNQQQLDHFGIGFAPDQWDSLTYALNELNIPEKVQIELGLVIRRESSSGCYDRFRNRVMFPIRNLLGRVIAFGGRAMSKDDPAKYLNSNDTPIFNKSRVLYLLDTAKNHMKENGAIIVEGYMDAIALHIHGFENTVASLGTALTKEHINILKRYTNQFTLLYDSDQAGINAAMRGVESFFEMELPVRVLQIQDEKDPDEYLQKHGPGKMQQLIDQAPDGFAFYLNQKRAGYNTNTPEGKTAIIQEMLPLFARIQTGLLFHDYTEIMAKMIGGDLSGMKDSIKRGLQKHKTYQPQPDPQSEAQPENSFQPLSGTIGNLKRELLCLLAYHHTLLTPEGMKPSDRVGIFSNEERTSQIPEILNTLRDSSIEDHLLEKTLQLKEEKIENMASFISDWLTSQTEFNAFIHITETTTIPNTVDDLRKMKTAVINGLQQEIQQRKYQELVQSGTSDFRSYLKAADQQLLGQKE